MMCAIAAGRRGRRVVVLEHNSEPGRKILISGRHLLTLIKPSLALVQRGLPPVRRPLPLIGVALPLIRQGLTLAGLAFALVGFAFALQSRPVALVGLAVALVGRALARSTGLPLSRRPIPRPGGRLFTVHTPSMHRLSPGRANGMMTGWAGPS